MYQILQKFDIHWHGGGPSIAMIYHIRRVSDLLYDWKSCLLRYMKDVVLHCSIFFKWNKIVRVRVRVLKLTPVHSKRVVSCPVQPRSCHWDCGFLHNFIGMTRTCWTTGSWRRCLSRLSLEVVSSIPAGSTIIYLFLCGFICVSLCQSIKIEPTNMYNASVRAHFKINTHGCWIDTCAFQTGCQLPSAASVMSLGLCFFYTISLAWSERVGQVAAGGVVSVASVWRSWVRSPPGPR